MSATLPPLALEAVLKLLAVGQSTARGDFAAAIPAEKPTLRLDGAAQTPAMPAWPGVSGRLELPRGVPGRPARRAPGRNGHNGHNGHPQPDPRHFLGEE
ncbi:MAG TPA: hypothetical protein VGO34_10860 [Alphaproteobacteria bacterium]